MLEGGTVNEEHLRIALADAASAADAATAAAAAAATAAAAADTRNTSAAALSSGAGINGSDATGMQSEQLRVQLVKPLRFERTQP